MYLPNDVPIQTMKDDWAMPCGEIYGVATIHVIFFGSIGNVSTSIGEGERHLMTVI